MSRSRPPDRLASARATLAAILLLLVCCPACSNKEPAPEHIYTVRGRIVALPDPASPGSNLEIQHEAVPDFVNVKGERVGMSSMVMPFATREGLSLKGLA